MARLSKDSVKLNSSADLRAMRDAKSAVQPGPMLEAARRAQAIRDGLNSFANAIEAMAEAWNRDDWKTLGYGSWQEYCQEEFDPSKVRLTVEQRRQAVGQLTSAGLTKRAASAALGVSHTTVQNDARGGKKLPLPAAPEQDSGDVGEGVSGRTAADSDASADGAAGSAEGALPSPPSAPAGEPAPPVGSPVTPDPSTDESVSKSQLDATSVEVSSPSPAVPPDPAGQETGQDVPAPASPRNDLLVGGPGPDSPAGRPWTPDGPEGSHHVATGQPGQDLSPEDGGDASNAQSSISLTDRVEGPGSVGDGLEEGGIPLEPSSSPDLSSPEGFVLHLERFVEELDRVLDIDALGPLMTEDQLGRAQRAADNVAWVVGMLRTWNEKR